MPNSDPTADAATATATEADPVADMADGIEGLADDLTVAAAWLKSRRDVLRPHVHQATMRVARLIHPDARTIIALQCRSSVALAICTRLLLAGEGTLAKEHREGAVWVSRTWGRVTLSAWASQQVVCDQTPDGSWDCGAILAHLDAQGGR